MKTPAPDAAASSTPARKRTKTRPAARRRTTENTYSDPALRERLKTEIRAAAKGGEPGTWSARKSQLLTLAYQKSGGGYLQRHPNSKPKSLHHWPTQEWPTDAPLKQRPVAATPKATSATASKKSTPASRPTPAKVSQHATGASAEAGNGRKQAAK